MSARFGGSGEAGASRSVMLEPREAAMLGVARMIWHLGSCPES